MTKTTNRKPHAALRVRITKTGYTILCRSKKVSEAGWRDAAEAFASGWYDQPMKLWGDRFVTPAAYEANMARIAAYAAPILGR